MGLVWALAAPASAQVVDRCWDGSKPKAYAQATRLWRVLTTTPAGTTLSTKKPRVGRLGDAEWATAVSFQIPQNLENRELTAATVTLTFKTITGAPAVNVIPYGWGGYGGGVRGSIERASAQDLLVALTYPGVEWAAGGGVFSTRGPHVIGAGDLADFADQIAWDEELDWLSFFLEGDGREGWGELKQVTLTLYHCPLEDPFSPSEWSRLQFAQNVRALYGRLQHVQEQ